MNHDKSFWNKALFTTFLPEAVFQSIIALSWAVPFRTGAAGAVGPSAEYADALHGLAVGLYAAGLGMEVLADSQLETHRRKSDDLNREGVWSIVRHPK